MLGLQGTGLKLVPLAEVAGKMRHVPLDHPLIASGRRVGTSFGTDSWTYGPGRRGDLGERLHHRGDCGGWQRFRDHRAEHEAAVGRFHRDDFQRGSGADFHMHVAGGRTRPARGERQAAGEEMQAAVVAFVENHRAFAIENEDPGRGEMMAHPVPETLDAIQKRAAGGGWRWFQPTGGSGSCGTGGFLGWRVRRSVREWLPGRGGRVRWRSRRSLRRIPRPRRSPPDRAPAASGARPGGGLRRDPAMD